MDTLIAGAIVFVGLTNVVAVLLATKWLLASTRHTVDSVVALKLANGSQPAFHEALDKLRETGIVPDVADVPDAGTPAPEPISRIVQVRGPEGEPAETVELIGEGFFDDPSIISGRQQ